MTPADRRDFAALCRRHRIRALAWPFGLTFAAVVVPEECVRVAMLVSRRTGRLVCAGVVWPSGNHVAAPTTPPSEGARPSRRAHRR
jgi:hypothetical protein